jgi:hypothetical protein
VPLPRPAIVSTSGVFTRQSAMSFWRGIRARELAA